LISVLLIFLGTGLTIQEALEEPLDDMMEVHTLSDGSEVFMLSGSKEYTDTDGNKYYSPFPVKITAQED
jgi:hypothetical protein